jgi:hypothetical protein
MNENLKPLNLINIRLLLCLFLTLWLNSSSYANVTISSNTNISNAGLSSLNDGDTLFIDAQLRINQDFSLASVKDLVIIVNSNGSIHYNANHNNQLTFDSSVTLNLNGNGTISVGGGCQHQKKIFLNSVEYANCGGRAPSNKSFQDIENDGGINLGGISLPVTLGNVTGTINNNILTISWRTFMEYNSSHYELNNY